AALAGPVLPGDGAGAAVRFLHAAQVEVRQAALAERRADVPVGQAGGAAVKGILLHGHDEVIEGRARAAGLKVVVAEGLDVPFERTLITRPGTHVPFDLLPAAWNFLRRW